MTKHDFIFSNQRRHRIARHVAFWVVWLLLYLILFHYPVHSFKGWDLSQTPGTLQRIGATQFIVKTLIFNALLAIVVPHAAFTYVLLYWLLPRYFYQKRNPLIVVSVIIGVLLGSLFVFASFRIMVNIGNYLFGNRNFFMENFSYRYSAFSVIREMFTSFPIVVGFAVMIKLMKRWWLKQEEIAQLAKEKTKAELQLLKAQVHPHFLFNTLNNIYFFTLSGSSRAPEMINKLSGLLHYILNECNQPLVALEKEINMIRDYMALEKIRYGEQMNMSIEIQDEGSHPRAGAGEAWERNSGRTLIAPLLLIPFVENSFKHGTSKMIAHPWVKLTITIEKNMLHFFIMNSRPQEAEPLLKKGNIGLKNVKKRLQLLYPGAHELNIVSEPERFAVYLKIQLKEITASLAYNGEIKSTAEYAMV